MVRYNVKEYKFKESENKRQTQLQLETMKYVLEQSLALNALFYTVDLLPLCAFCKSLYISLM